MYLWYAEVMILLHVLSTQVPLVYRSDDLTTCTEYSCTSGIQKWWSYYMHWVLMYLWYTASDDLTTYSYLWYTEGNPWVHLCHCEASPQLQHVEGSILRFIQMSMSLILGIYVRNWNLRWYTIFNYFRDIASRAFQKDRLSFTLNYVKL